MKRFSKVINARSSSSSSKTRLTTAAEHAESDKITAQKVKFASLHEEDDEEEEEEDDDGAAHRLKQNPKKTLRVSTSKSVVNNQQKFVCNKCGKAFQSSKAMCGHMACHSEKEKPLSNAVAKKKMVMMDSESDSESETGAGKMKRRLRRTRFKKHDYVADSKVKLDVVDNCSSESSGIEQEQEEVAIGLMMLSRDSSNWSGLNYSSENNSVVLQDRSNSTRLGNKDGLSKYGLNEIKERHRMKKFESLDGFDSGYVRNGINPRKNKLEEDSNCEPHLSLKKLKSLMDGEGYSQIKRPKMESYPRNGALNESQICNRVEHKALIHSQSHQPFDVNVADNKQHTAGRKNMRKGKGITDDDSGNVNDNRKKGKYKSPVCSKAFRSNHEIACQQSLHLTEGSEDNKYDEISANVKRQVIQSHDLFDLNMPAPMEDDEANESMGSY